MRIPTRILVLTAISVLAACTSQKEPAEHAVAKVTASLDEIRADAQQYAAEQLQTVDASVTRLKENLDKKDYDAVVQGAPSVSSAVADLKTTVATAKADAEATLAAAQSEWNDLSAAVPPLVEKLQARVDQLSKTRKYPKGMDKAAFEAAKTGFESLKTEWTEAGSEFTSGQAANAVRKARSAKAKAEVLIQQLEVPA
jgi:DNA repair exonuclease SbcCD ATPase subunit